MRYGRDSRAALKYPALLPPALDQIGAAAVAVDIGNFNSEFQ